MSYSVDPSVGLELLDVIQLKGVSRFSGCISVQGDDLAGLIFFRDGQIIHAEAGDLQGEAAFNAIAQHPGLPFSLQPNVTTTSHTIHRSWQFLLLDSQRLLDESRRGQPGASRPTPPPVAQVGTLDRIRRIGGVVWAALSPKTGAGTGPAGRPPDPTEEQVARLGALARVVGERLRLGEVVGATVHGSERNLLLVATRVHHLFVLLQGGPQAAATEAEVRKVLTVRR